MQTYVLNAAGLWAMNERTDHADEALGHWAHCYDGPLAANAARVDGRVAVELPTADREPTPELYREVGAALRAAQERYERQSARP